jgi:hypothetical protein
MVLVVLFKQLQKFSRIFFRACPRIHLRALGIERCSL